jgi:hypothetical protein
LLLHMHWCFAAALLLLLLGWLLGAFTADNSN